MESLSVIPDGARDVLVGMTHVLEYIIPNMVFTIFRSITIDLMKPVAGWFVFFVILHALSTRYSAVLFPTARLDRKGTSGELLIPQVLNKVSRLRGLRLWLFNAAHGLMQRFDITQMQLIWDTSVTAIFHAVVVSVLATYYFFGASFPNNDYVAGRNVAVTSLFAFSIGFFLYDSVLCTFLLDIQKDGFGFLFHAYTCLSAYAIFYFLPLFQYYGLSFLMYEISTLFLHLAEKYQQVTSRASLPLYAMFGLSYFLVRLVFAFFMTLDFTAMVFENYETSRYSFDLVVLCAPLTWFMYLLYWKWFYHIIRKGQRLLAEAQP